MKLSDITFPCYIIYADRSRGKIGHNGFALILWKSSGAAVYVNYDGSFSGEFKQQFHFDRSAALPCIGWNHYIIKDSVAHVIMEHFVSVAHPIEVDDNSQWWRLILGNSTNCSTCGGTGIEKVQLFTSIKEYPCSKCKVLSHVDN